MKTNIKNPDSFNENKSLKIIREMIEVSKDSLNYNPLISHKTEYPYCCANPQDKLWLPVLYESHFPNSHSNTLLIKFLSSTVQVGRVEIEYQ